MLVRSAKFFASKQKNAIANLRGMQSRRLSPTREEPLTIAEGSLSNGNEVHDEQQVCGGWISATHRETGEEAYRWQRRPCNEQDRAESSQRYQRRLAIIEENRNRGLAAIEQAADDAEIVIAPLTGKRRLEEEEIEIAEADDLYVPTSDDIDLEEEEALRNLHVDTYIPGHSGDNHVYGSAYSSSSSGSSTDGSGSGSSTGSGSGSGVTTYYIGSGSRDPRNTRFAFAVPNQHGTWTWQWGTTTGHSVQFDSGVHHDTSQYFSDISGSGDGYGSGSVSTGSDSYGSSGSG
jgi:hypothetical protein